MNSAFNWTKTRLILFTFACLFASALTTAEPYLALLNQQPCGTCHVNPTGGGMRNDYGRAYGSRLLAANQVKLIDKDLGKISDWLSIGGDFRSGFSRLDSGGSTQSQQGFAVDSGQIYLLISATDPSLSFYLDQRLSPGAALNREAYVLKRFENNDYLKVGKLMPAFGLKLEDDTAFTRQVTGFNFNNSDQGVEYGLQRGRSLYSFFISNGTSALSNDDDRFQYGARGEFLLDRFRLGGAFVLNDAEALQRKQASIFGGFTVNQLTFLGELVQISENLPGASDDLQARIGLLEMNWQFSRGHNIKLTEEYYDPNADIDEDQRVRHSLLYEYTPMANMQVRMGYRRKQAPPQFPAEQIDSLFIQAHFYF